MESSKNCVSPQLENQIRSNDIYNGGLVNKRRSRRSYSMVSSLDKLTNKLKNNLLDIANKETKK